MTPTTEIVLAEPSIEELTATVQREHALVVEAGLTMIDHAIGAGEALIAIKRRIPAGEWEEWLLAAFPEQSLRIPRAYMRVARHKDEIVALQPNNLNTALRLITDHKKTTYDPEMFNAVKGLYATGNYSMRQVAVELELPYHRVWRWLRPDLAARQAHHRKLQGKAGRRALARQQREADVRRKGGAIGSAYSLIRKALQELETASELEPDREVRKMVASAMQSAYNAEDYIVKASRSA